mmetsp:Transcript_37237/g.73109  ORF Transcript_37237/g.73109 Transcript_37237/m.73109 type:complete len:110 (+) Transcript_37237:1380-1709(+)
MHIFGFVTCAIGMMVFVSRRSQLATEFFFCFQHPMIRNLMVVTHVQSRTIRKRGSDTQHGCNEIQQNAAYHFRPYFREDKIMKKEGRKILSTNTIHNPNAASDKYLNVV